MPEQLVVGFNPMSAANKVAYFVRQIRSRLVWLIIAAVICVWIWLWQRQTMSAQNVGFLFGVGMAYSLVWLVIAVVNWRRAKKTLASITPDVAMAVSRWGLWIQGASVPWSDVSRVAIAPGRFGGSPTLTVARVSGPVSSISLAVLDMMPGSIDAAIRAYSGGQQWIDTSKLGN
ncbi:MAG: hypothetical protein LBV06_04855 [Propionibacteriaceae bacterium]|jgi:hypothetical protein|nr:hypothetical protein [Propionibacteriaceae bacterium]